MTKSNLGTAGVSSKKIGDVRRKVILLQMYVKCPTQGIWLITCWIFCWKWFGAFLWQDVCVCSIRRPNMEMTHML